MDFNSISKVLKEIKSKKISILELNKIFINRIKENKDINAFIYFNEDLIYKRCKELEKLKNNNLALMGIPIGIKDLFCTTDMPTTAGSRILKDSFPLKDSWVAKKLRESGAVILGKTNLSEWANYRASYSKDGQVR